MTPSNLKSYSLQPSESFFGNITASRAFSAQEIQHAVEERGIRIYVFGIVTYVDAFGQQRQTRFCRAIPGGDNLRTVSTGGEVTDGKFAFIFTDQHNDST